MADRIPTVRVYMAFDGSTWQTAEGDISWTEVTSSVSMQDRIRIRRGKSSALDRFSAGTCSLTLLCVASRDFDPDYSGSPYAGDIVPGVPVKVVGEYDAGSGTVVYPRFRGFVDDWPQDHDLSNKLVKVQVSATDGFGILARQDLPTSWYALAVANDGPVAWWRMQATRDGDQMVDSSGNRHDGTLLNATFGLDSLVNDPSDKAVSIAHTADARGEYYDSTNLVPNAPPFTIECLVQVERTTDEAKYLWALQRDATSIGMGARVWYPTASPNGELNIQFSGWELRGTARIDDGLVHHIAIVCSSTSSVVLYVDGVADALITTVGASPFSPHTDQHVWTVGNLTRFSAGDFGLGGTIDEFAVYDRALSAGEVFNHAASAYLGGSSDGAFRLAEILDHVGWPADQRDVEPFDVNLGTGAFGLGSNALAEMQQIELSEQGRLYVAADGKLAGRGRYWYLTRTTPAFTASDDGAAGSVRYSRFSKRITRDRIRNIVKGSRQGGQEVDVRDDASRIRYGAAEHSLSGMYAASDSALRSTLEWILARYKDPHVDIDAIVVPLYGEHVATHAPKVLQQDFEDRIEVERTPMGIGSQDLYPISVDAIEDDIGPLTWDVTIAGSTVDTDTSFGVWGTGVWDTALWA